MKSPSKDSVHVNYKVTRARRLLPVPASWNGLAQTSPALDSIHGTHLSEYWQFNKDGMYTAVYREEEWDRCAKIVAEKLIHDDSYLSGLLIRQNEQGEKLVSLSHATDMAVDSMEDVEKLYVLYKQLREEWIIYDMLSVYPWYLGAEGLNAYVQDLLIQLGLTADEITALSIPEALTFSTEEELTVTSLALRQLQGAPEEEVGRDISGLVEKYFWISFGYDGPEQHGDSYYRSMISELASKGERSLARRIEEILALTKDAERARDDIIRKYGISDTVQKAVRRVRQLPLEADVRKQHTYQAHIALSRVLDNISRLLRIERRLLNYVTLEEIETAADPEVLAKMAEKRETQWYVMYFQEGKMESIDGERAAALATAMISAPNDLSAEIRGTPGSIRKGKTVGIVRVLMSAKDAHELKEGEILVAPMTTPEFVPAMRKAAAIVTDEGGITCHAAIVSRELGLPCIVGTKVATQLLRDGDMVEVDAEKGTVRKV